MCCSPYRMSRHVDEAIILRFLCIDGEDLVIILNQLAQRTAFTEGWPLKTKSLVQQRDTGPLKTDPSKHEHDRVSRSTTSCVWSQIIASILHTFLFSGHFIFYVLLWQLFVFLNILVMGTLVISCSSLSLKVVKQSWLDAMSKTPEHLFSSAAAWTLVFHFIF